MKAIVVGYGISGKASAALARQKGWQVAAVDRNARAMQADVPLFPEDAPPSLDGVTLVIVSPGVPPTHSLLAAARARGIEIVGEIEFAFRYVEQRCIGVTGTNGKTTTALLIAHVLNACGISAKAVGNVGFALSDYLLAPNLKETLVVELSSFQLETLKQTKFAAAVYLNLTPDHLDRYANLRDYAAAKARIQECLVPGGKLFVSRQVLVDYGDLFQADSTRCFEVLAPIHELQYTQWGKPERQNTEAARAICSELGISSARFDEALNSFAKPAHRIERIGTFGGVDYVNDSKGTNIDAVLHAAALFKGPLVLIVGGVDKGSSYQPWIEPMKGKVRKMIAYGEAALKILLELKGHFALEHWDRFGDAVRAAMKVAQRGDTVLLSPGCSSFDQHKNYAHRGDEFKEIIFHESEKHHFTRSSH